MGYGEYLRGKVVLITGATGSLGRTLLPKILACQPKTVRLFSRDEAKQYELQQEYAQQAGLRYLLGDVRDKERLKRAMEGVQVVFHLASLKHVPLCEYNPYEAVQTNVVGTQNVIDAALVNYVERVVYTSSDKAVSPTNTMGATKLLAERLISAAQQSRGTRRTVFSAVRFGNVLNSRGSVIEVFKRQIRRGGPITVTDPEMTRFMMTLSQASNLTIRAGELAEGGEVFVLKMPVIRLQDLVEVVVEEYAPIVGKRSADLEIETIGLRPGEKRFEELMTPDESAMALELPDMYVLPMLDEQRAVDDDRPKTVSSAEIAPIPKEELRQLLLMEGVFQD
ncbi:polysaccharide biosynthesis protein capd, putative [Heliomicrobium modesticaldum Ice1]|uniref:Polysaccharide biosynthesis protein capd, putative n=1 Tax=Heliobacterium modesticaldum (strain ATCC 51547 / Ice1) TaxID=498761 RepID=B0TH32_HELMI|nr:UDP-N-acetylglucosamine 4,6-dehydratase family protein [Heliomicrobium modesticaldum]ABZ83357.1 polysaccharide biosynthesis protein capd, putative [Heliomicrobium modesticaldum Ice1]